MTSIQTWLVDQWAEENARTLQSMTDARPSVSCSRVEPGEVAAATAGAAVTEVTFSLGPDAAMWLAIPDSAADEFGLRTLRAAGIEDAGPEEVKNTSLEIVQQCHAGLAQAISRRVQRGVTSRGLAAASFPASQPIFKLELTYPGDPPVSTFFTLSPELIAAIETSGSVSASKPVEVSVASKQQAAAAPLNSKTFDVLLDVSMPVSVSFGRTEMPIKEVLKLTTGSIVELDRNVTEPVDVIVNDRIIARGEVVVVDGNYGVRIQQIVSPQERFHSSTQAVEEPAVVPE